MIKRNVEKDNNPGGNNLGHLSIYAWPLLVKSVVVNFQLKLSKLPLELQHIVQQRSIPLESPFSGQSRQCGQIGGLKDLTRVETPPTIFQLDTLQRIYLKYCKIGFVSNKLFQ